MVWLVIYTNLCRAWQGFFFFASKRKKGIWDLLLVNYLEKQPTFKITGLELNYKFQ